MIWSENWDIVTAFLAVTTQWNVVALSSMSGTRLHWLGLDYAAVRARLDPERLTEDLWGGLQAMELAAREVLNS